MESLSLSVATADLLVPVVVPPLGFVTELIVTRLFGEAVAGWGWPE